jgi:hypothetical protein
MRSLLLLVAAGLSALVAAGTTAETAQQAGSRPGGRTATEAEARALCGTACHAFPPPDALPRAEWADSVGKMELFRTGRPVPVGPPGTIARLVKLPEDMQRVLRFYTSRAPRALPEPDPWPAVATSPRVRFERRNLTMSRPRRSPAVSNVRFFDIEGDARPEIVATDMRYGYVLVGRPADPDRPNLEIVADVPHPAHVEAVDFDGDGLRDLIVADLGSFPPEDHDRGGIVWLKRREDGTFGPLDVRGFPRVADVRPGDFDGDGKPDLLIGAFGWRKTGFITLLRNRTIDYAQPSLESHQVDGRSGTVHVPTADLNGDGRLDFVALLAQEHETVVAYLNDGQGGFTPQTIYTAPHPNWGSSGIQLVDFDADGDLDVLVTNGDSFDDALIKPYHGIQWLENTGGFPFTAHPIAAMAGVHRAQAVDLDGDGDLDVVACALLGQTRRGSNVDLPSLVWLERTGRNTFTRHTLSRGVPQHASLDTADFDGDGDIDIVVGNFAATRQVESSLVLWVNQLKEN